MDPERSQNRVVNGLGAGVVGLLYQLLAQPYDLVLELERRCGAGFGAAFDRGLLHPWSSYLVIPLFALANAGVSFSGQAAGEALGSRVTLGVVLGLVLGKPLGILAASWLVTRMGLASKPEDVTWRQLTGIGVVAGIGFTMSLFVAGLAFAEGPQFEEAKMGILAASVIAGLAGWLVLRRA